MASIIIKEYTPINCNSGIIYNIIEYEISDLYGHTIMGELIASIVQYWNWCGWAGHDKTVVVYVPKINSIDFLTYNL